MPRRRYDEEEEFEPDEHEEELGEEGGESYELDEEEEFFDDEEELEEDSLADGDESNEYLAVESVLEEGEELIDAGELDKAVEHLEQGVEAFPDEPKMHYLYGLALFEKLKETTSGDDAWFQDTKKAELYESALAEFDQALSIDEEYVDALNRMGDMCEMRGNYEAAIACWEKSVEIEPDQSEVIKDIKHARKKLDE